MCILHNTHTYIVTIVLGDLCDNIGLVGISAKWSHVTASPSHHDQAIPILSPLLFMHVGHPFLKVEEFLIYLSRLFFNFLTGSNMYMHICIIFTSPSPSPPFFPHCSITLLLLIWLVLSLYIYVHGRNRPY